MNAARHHGPTLYIEETFYPFLWRLTDVFGEECECRWHFRRSRPLLHPFLDPGQDTRVCVIEVRQKRRADRLRYPVNHDLCQQFVLSEARLDVATTIAPCTEFLYCPRCQSGRGIIQSRSQALQFGGLN